MALLGKAALQNRQSATINLLLLSAAVNTPPVVGCSPFMIYGREAQQVVVQASSSFDENAGPGAAAMAASAAAAATGVNGSPVIGAVVSSVATARGNFDAEDASSVPGFSPWDGLMAQVQGILKLAKWPSEQSK
jgi:hypothetical protein